MALHGTLNIAYILSCQENLLPSLLMLTNTGVQTVDVCKQSPCSLCDSLTHSHTHTHTYLLVVMEQDDAAESEAQRNRVGPLGAPGVCRQRVCQT